MQFNNVSAKSKANIYFEGKVVSQGITHENGEREHFVALMRKLEAFHGMRVVTY